MSETDASSGPREAIGGALYLQRALALIIAVCAAASCLGLALQHPVAPEALVGVLCVAMAWAAWQPQTIGWVLAVLLPIASFAPSTGWWLVDEFDLLLLGVVAGAYGRWCLDAFEWRAHPAAVQPTRSAADAAVDRIWTRLLVALGASSLLSLGIGLRDAGVGLDLLVAAWTSGDWLVRALHADYANALNSLRVSKSVLWALLLYPLLRRGSAIQQRRTAHLTVNGMAYGLALVCVLVLWERLRYVGIFNFTDSYRTVASFWEMHVGGGAIDAYLAMTVPVAFWAVWLAPGGWRWVCAALLAVLGTYAVLTTYSRGVYLAMAMSLVGMGVLAWRCQIRPATGGRRRGWALGLLALALLAESLWILGGHSFMSGRLARSEVDLVDRVAHWKDGLSLLQTPADWLFGLGAGRLPAHYSAQVPGGEFPGRVQWQRERLNAGSTQLSGPPTRQDIAYDFGLTQRVDLEQKGHYRVRLRYETDAPLVLLVSVCERHLLYDFRCQWKHVRSGLAITDRSQWHDIALSGPAFAATGRATRWRDGMFTLTVLSTGQTARLHAVELIDPSGRQVLRNTDFSTGLQHWFPAAQSHFKPWHMDNLYLEVLIERGVLGWLALGLVAVWATRRSWLSLRQREPLALALMGSLMAMGVVGLVISVTEIPRVAFMLLLVVLTTSRLQRIPQYSQHVTDCNQGLRAVFSQGRQSREEPQRPSQGKEV